MAANTGYNARVAGNKFRASTKNKNSSNKTDQHRGPIAADSADAAIAAKAIAVSSDLFMLRLHALLVREHRLLWDPRRLELVQEAVGPQ